MKVTINKVTELCPSCGAELSKIPKSNMSGYIGKPYYACTKLECEYWRVISEDERLRHFKEKRKCGRV